MNKRFIFLAKLGIIESTDENGDLEIQRIDEPEIFSFDYSLNFVPPLLKGDKEAKQKIIEIYLDWVNNFISLDKFADHYGLDEIDAHYVIDLGRALNNRSF